MVKEDSISRSMIYKNLERYIAMGVQIIVQIIIARILGPDEYGLVAMMTVFISLATVFIQSGFNMALVQKKTANNSDYSTALITNLLLGLFLYIILFLFTPLISEFYGQEEIKHCFPILSLLLIFGSFNSIQIAIANRQMQFKTLLKCNTVASISSGLLGVLSAFIGVGYWALVIQQLSNSILLAIMLFVKQQWKPSLSFNIESAMSMFNFGWKMLAAALINQLFSELNSLVIGKKYTASDLAFYTKGQQFPKYATMGVDSSISTVMFSAFSKKQSDLNSLHSLMKKAICVNSYLVFFILTVLCCCGNELVLLLLSDSWQPMVIFMQIACLVCSLHPIAAVQVQSIAAVGRSDLRLKTEFLKKGVGFILLFLAIPYGPLAIAISAMATGLFGVLVGAIVCQRIVKYKVINSLMDLFPIIICSILSGGGMLLIGEIDYNTYLVLTLKLLTGMVIYVTSSHLLKVYGYLYIKNLIKRK